MGVVVTAESSKSPGPVLSVCCRCLTVSRMTAAVPRHEISTRFNNFAETQCGLG